MMETNWLNELDEVQLEILNNPNLVDFAYERTITVEEFIKIFNERFHGLPVAVNFFNDYVDTGLFFDQAIIYFNNNKIQFAELDEEASYSLRINMNNIQEIQMTDYWLDKRYPEFEMGAVFNFVGNDDFHIEVKVE